MAIFSLYIYDRHCQCVYYQDWHRTKRPGPATEQGLIPGVSHAVMSAHPSHPAGLAPAEQVSGYNSPRNTLSSASGVIVAVNDVSSQVPGPGETGHRAPSGSGPGGSSALPFDEEAKLVFGVVFSLRNMVKKLSGRDEHFTNYRTSTYRLHLYESISGYKFVMLSDHATDSLRFALRQIYNGPFLEYFVRNPLSDMDSRDRGIDNEYFRAGTDRLVKGLSSFS